MLKHIVKYVFVKNPSLQSAFSSDIFHNQAYSNIFIKNGFKPSLYSLITKASVKILPLAFFNKLSYLFGTTFWKWCLYHVS